MPEADQRFTHVLNVIANDAAAVADCLGAFGGAQWLSPGYAFDIPLRTDTRSALARARDLAADFEADINVVRAAGRRKRLLIADMDSTIINCEVVDELADFAHVHDAVAAITARAVAGEIEFEDAVRERVALLRGLPLDRLPRAYAERIRLNPGAKALVATMHVHGAYSMLVSGGYTWFTDRVAADVGFDMNEGNVLLDDGRTISGIAEPVRGRAAKLETLKRVAGEMNIALEECIAVGDGANDLDMIRAAGLGVAYHAKPVVAEAAAATVVYGDLTALLYLQGYRDEEIAQPY